LTTAPRHPGYFRAAAVTAGLAAGLFLAEILLRAAGAAYSASRLPGQDLAFDTQERVRVLCLGDSYTFGIGAPAGDSYPEQLQRLFDKEHPGKVRVINRGVPGSNSSMVLRDIEDSLDLYAPAIVVLLTGANDNSNFESSSYPLFQRGRRAVLARLDARLSGLRTYKLLKDACRALRETRGKGTAAFPPAAQESFGTSRELDIMKAVDAAGAFERAADFSSAERALKKALARYPEDPRLLRPLALLQMEAGDDASAKKTLQFAHAQAPRDYGIALALFMTCHRTADEACIREALGFMQAADPADEYSKRLLDYGVPAQDDLRTAQKVLNYDLRGIARLCERRKVRLILQTYFGGFWASETISAFAKENKVPCVDQWKPFDAYPDRARLFAADGHLNSEGYRRAARNVYEFLLPFLDPSPGLGPTIVTPAEAGAQQIPGFRLPPE